MRDKIYVEDIERLSEKGKKALKQWSQDNLVHELEYHATGVRIWENVGGDSGGYYQGLPLLTVGQMVGLLEKDETMFITSVNNENEHAWIVNGVEKEELADALWEHVKKKLEK